MSFFDNDPSVSSTLEFCDATIRWLKPEAWSGHGHVADRSAGVENQYGAVNCGQAITNDVDPVTENPNIFVTGADYVNLNFLGMAGSAVDCLLQ